MLIAAASAARERGAAAVSVSDVVVGAGVSRRTFYEIFGDRDDCLRAVFEEALRRAAAVVVPAWQSEPQWRDAIREALYAFLCFLDEEPTLGTFLVVDSLGAGDWALERRAETIGVLVDVVDMGRALARFSSGASDVIAEGVVGGVLSIVHGRLLGARAAVAPASMAAMLGELLKIVLLPYLGLAAAAREARRPHPPAPLAGPVSRDGGLGDLEIRLTYRTVRVLRALADLEAEGRDPSNRQVSEHAGIEDQGQASKLLSRLARAMLIENLGGCRELGEPNAWRLTARGAAIERATRGDL